MCDISNCRTFIHSFSDMKQIKCHLCCLLHFQMIKAHHTTCKLILMLCHKEGRKERREGRMNGVREGKGRKEGRMNGVREGRRGKAL